MSNGQERATTDSTTIRNWWWQWPNANIGVATGQASGIFVLDVDGADGEAAVVDLERRRGAMLTDPYPMQWPGRPGGWQAVIGWPHGRTIRNSAGRLRAALDSRGEAGYVVAAPSTHPNGNRYRWGADRSPRDVEPAGVPAWLVNLLDPPAADVEPIPWNGSQHRGDVSRRALKALEAELALVAVAPSGRRNEQLNRSTFALLRFVASGELPHHPVLARPGWAEAVRTIRSAARSRGMVL